MNRNDFDPGPLAHVECRLTDEQPTLVFVRHFRHGPEKVWVALTDPEQMKEWAPFVPDANLATAGAATLTMAGGADGAPPEEFKSVVTRAERPKMLEYTWDTSILRWELEPVDSGTKVTLSHTVDTSDWIPKIAAGWHICLAVADRLLSGDPVGPIVGEQAMNYGWQDLHDRYARELGIESADGPTADDEQS
jgi:uncharacterized protein YndB with AHSA1/START domain